MDEPATGGSYGVGWTDLVVLYTYLDESMSKGEGRQGCLPPKPVANPTVPSVASISTRKDPRTLMPQLVLDFLYWSQMEQGVEISESINLTWTRGVSFNVMRWQLFATYFFHGLTSVHPLHYDNHHLDPSSAQDYETVYIRSLRGGEFTYLIRHHLWWRTE